MSHINSKFRAMLSILAMLSISACATTLRSTVDTADHADLDGFRTFAWITEQASFDSSTQAPEFVNPLNEQRVRAAIEEQLERKGYRKASLTEADLVVTFTLGARHRIRVQNYYDDFGYGYHGYYLGFSPFRHGYGGYGRYGRYGGYGGFGGYGGYGGLGRSGSVRTFTEGTLVVDIFSNSEKEALWHGSATKRLSRDDNTRELIDEAVTALFAQFPDSRTMPDLVRDLTS